MNCENAHRLLHLNRPGERTPHEDAILYAHLVGCPSCVAEAEQIERLMKIEPTWRSAEVSMPDLRHLRARVLTATSDRGSSRSFTRVAFAVASLAVVGWFIAGQTNVHLAQSRLHDNVLTSSVRAGGLEVVYAVDPKSVAHILPSGRFRSQGTIEVSQAEVEDWMRVTEHELQRASLQGPDRRARIDTAVRTIRSSVTITIRFRTPGV